jgi:Leu/Phe-tRNA-protein transferase
MQLVVLEIKAVFVHRQWMSEEIQPVMLALARHGLAHAILILT